MLAAGLPGMASSEGLEKGAWEISGMGAWSYSDESGPVDEAGAFAEDTHLSENGHFFAFFLGGKLRLSESFYFNLQPTLTLVNIGESEALGFRVGTGFSGTF